MNTYWADLHNHNAVGYGKGSLERSYALAENTLDVYAFTPHGYWPDPPASDPKMVNYHVERFDFVSAAFPKVIEAANAGYRPGRFVTFVAYEWHSTRWGDYVVLFPGAEGELYRAPTLEALQAFARERGALLIPHHIGYRLGWRGLDWNAVDPALSPVAEVFSEHGNSLEREGAGPMLPHSMGGVTASQTVLEQVRRGRHIGFTAGTDDHFGYPANYGEGITGILAPELTREAVFDALRRRHTLAATGDRIGMSIRSGEAVMGDRADGGAPRRFEIRVEPLAPLDYVEVLRNGEVAAIWPGPAAARLPGAGEYVVRVDWGWGRLAHAELTDWRVRFGVKDGRLVRVVPCFCGGAASTERVNRIQRLETGGIEIASFTSRQNTSPTNGVVLVIDGDAATRLRLSASATVEEARGACDADVSLAELLRDDAWVMPLERFSSPRLRLGLAHRLEALAFRAEWQDPAPAARATYILKARQQNGQCAWTSPILFEAEAG